MSENAEEACLNEISRKIREFLQVNMAVCPECRD